MKKNKNTTATTIPESEMPAQENGGQQKNGSVVRRKKKEKKVKNARNQKGLSAPPDIGGQSVISNGGATPYKGDPEEAPRVKVKLYRSYADLEKFMQEKLRETRPDLRVYRRSTASLDRSWKRNKTKSMPVSAYDMDHSRDSGNESAGGSFLNGTVLSDSGTPGSEHSSRQWALRPGTSTPNQNGPLTATNGPTSPVTPGNNMPPKDGRRSNASSNGQSIPSVPECEYLFCCDFTCTNTGFANIFKCQLKSKHFGQKNSLQEGGGEEEV